MYGRRTSSTTSASTLAAVLASVVVAAVLVAGCGGDGSATGSPRSGSTATGTATAAPTPTPTPAPTTGTPSATPEPPGASRTPAPASGTPFSDVLVDYHRSGGLAGLSDQVTVHSDGRVTRLTRTERCDFRLNPSQLAGLRTDLERAGFATLRWSTRPPRVADGFSYLVAYHGVTVRTYDTVIPRPLQPAMSRLAQIASIPCIR